VKSVCQKFPSVALIHEGLWKKLKNNLLAGQARTPSHLEMQPAVVLIENHYDHSIKEH